MARQKSEGGHLARLGRHTAGADQGRVRVHGTYIQTRRVTCDAPIASSRSCTLSWFACPFSSLHASGRLSTERRTARAKDIIATNQLICGSVRRRRGGSNAIVSSGIVAMSSVRRAVTLGQAALISRTTRSQVGGRCQRRQKMAAHLHQSSACPSWTATPRGGAPTACLRRDASPSWPSCSSVGRSWWPILRLV